LDCHLGRAAAPRDQLSHRVRRRAQQPAAGRPRDAQALADPRRARRGPEHRLLRALAQRPRPVLLPISISAAAALVGKRGAARTGAWLSTELNLSFVMAGLVPAIHVLLAS